MFLLLWLQCKMLEFENRFKCCQVVLRGHPPVAPQPHRLAALLLDLGHLGPAQLLPPLERSRLGVSEGARHSALVGLGVRVQKLGHPTVHFEVEETEHFSRVIVRVHGEIFISEHSGTMQGYISLLDYIIHYLCMLLKSVRIFSRELFEGVIVVQEVRTQSGRVLAVRVGRAPVLQQHE